MGTITMSSTEMKAIQRDSIKASLVAIKVNPTAYANLKSSVNYILIHGVEVDEWEYRATEIADSLDLLIRAGRGTYFYYPYKNINPEIYGKASELRKRCQELKQLFIVLKK